MVEKKDSDILSQIHKVRELVNISHIHHKFYTCNESLFLQMCSSMDVIEDTQSAIQAYKQNNTKGDIRLLYLHIYGLLQAFYVQQDAVVHLCQSIGIKVDKKKYPEIEEIRRVRNMSVGHPTKHDGNDKSFISHPTVRHSGYTLLTFYSKDNKSKSFEVNLYNLIEKQNNNIKSVLKEIVAELEEIDRQHKEKYRMKKLISVFPQDMNYILGKISEGIYRPDYAEISLLHLNSVIDVCKKYREAVEERGEDGENLLESVYEEVHHIHEYMKCYFKESNGQDNSSKNQITARIFFSHLQRIVALLKDNAKEIDNKYDKK